MRHQLQTPLINLLACGLVSASSVRHLGSRKGCQMVSQVCSVLCLTTKGADPTAAFSDVVDISPQQDASTGCQGVVFIPFHLTHRKFK